MKNFQGKTVLTLDCYGTLIDWETGLWRALEPLLARHQKPMRQDDALELFASFEARAEAGPYMTYREVLATVLKNIGVALGFEPRKEEMATFAGSVGDWPEFSDSPAALISLKKRFKLAVITNCDDDLFALSNKRLKVAFDHIITAQQARSYKPALNNFRIAYNRLGTPRGEILHVAQSLFHDHEPAKYMGIETVWINRRHDKPGFGATPAALAKPDYEFPDMRSFAAAAL
jgi:2-haloacid dehalogenase